MGHFTIRLASTIPPEVSGAAVMGPSSASEPNALLYLLGGGSLVTILGMLGAAFKGWYTGKNKALVRREVGLVEQRDTAWEERDTERRERQRAERNLRRVESHAGQLVYLLHRHGVPADDIPAYPKLEHDPPSTTES